MNKKSMVLAPIMVMIAFLLSGCEIMGSIFKAGVWTGVIAVIVIVAIVIFIIAKLFSKNKN